MDIVRPRLNRSLADGIRRVGFRKWYERELLSSHAYMVLALLSLVAIVASFEAFRGGAVYEQLMDAMFVIVSTAAGLWSLRRYLFLLMRAEGVANQASCGDCGEYGRLRVVGENPSHDETRVSCSKCQHQWTICT